MADMNKQILVIGGTGQQGGSVAEALLSTGWSIRVLTRDKSSEKVEALRAKGAEIVEGDLDEIESLEAAFVDIYGIYSVQSAPSGDIEVRWGKSVVDVAKKYEVQHIGYSSVAGVEKLAYQGALTKNKIEKHIQSVGIPYTFIRPASFMENYFRLKRGIFRGRITRQLKPTTREETIAVRDIGSFVAAAFNRPNEFKGQAIDIAGDNPSMSEVASEFTRRIGRPITYVQMPRDQVEERMPAQLVALMDWVEKDGYGVDIPKLKDRWGVPLTTFGEWLDSTEWVE